MMNLPIVDQTNANFTSSNGPIAIPLQPATDTPPDVDDAGPAPVEAHLDRLRCKHAASECVGHLGENGYFRRDDATLLRAALPRAITVVKAG